MREHLDGRTVIRKEPRGPDSRDRLRHELAMLDRLNGVDGVVQLAAAPPRPGSIALEDVDGVCLARQTMPLDISRLSGLALGLARAVAGMHHRGVLHRDIQPGNIVLSHTQGTPYLVDFASATTFAEIRQEFTYHSEFVGNLAYAAPEQSGRTGRRVDQRADLYALGATFYELASGLPPFGTSDPLRLSHDHLARMPVPPNRVNSAVPPVLSEIIMHLLEKEPDRRYQTADGLVHDLVRLNDARLDVSASTFAVGERDFPLRLVAPSRLVGRETEIAALGRALADAASGRCRTVLVSGGPGVGKSALIDQLRPIVAANNGWLVAGRFDRYRRDRDFDAVWQGIRSLGRLLLAEPDEELAEMRERMLDVLGADAGLMVAQHPSYHALLGVPPDSTIGNPLTVEARLTRIKMDVLRVVAARKRPVVFVVDDLHWATRTALGFIDTILSGEVAEGLMLVGTYREDEVDATHPLSGMLSRWHQRPDGLDHLRLDNLTPSHLSHVVGDMLRLDPARAGPLAEVIEPYTKGNPFDTVELLNALRHDEVLNPGDGEWQWDPVALRRWLRRADLDVLLAERAAAMPPETASLLRTLANLGGRVRVEELRVAIDTSASEAERLLAPALEDGLLIMEQDDPDPTVRFHDDRVQQVIVSRMDREHRHALRLQIARRLAHRPELFAVAAEQYLPVVDGIRDPEERTRVASLLTKAADQAELLGNHSMMERFLAAAAELTDPADADTLVNLLIARHAALYRSGRLDETDETFRAIDRLGVSPAQRTDATILQVSSLSTRGHGREALELGLDQLRRLGVPVPPPERLQAEIDRGLTTMRTWLDESSEVDDLHRPETANPAVPPIAALINRLLPASFVCDQAVMAWLALEAMRLWIEHGPARGLVGPMGHLVFVVVVRQQDYRTAHRVMQRVLAVAEGRDYEAETAQVNVLYAITVGYWLDPPAENVARAHRAHDRLVEIGDLQNACFTYYVTVPQLLESSPSLDSYVEEVEAALAFARRAGNSRAAAVFSAHRQLARTLRGEGGEPADRDTATPEQGESFDLVVVYITRALTAALLGDFADLSRQTAAAMPLVTSLAGTLRLALAYVLRGLAIATEVRTDGRGERGPLLAELDAIIDWLAARATDAPANVLHLLRFIEAERAWAVGDFRTAAYAFDVAQREAASRAGHWHRALIVERAARLYLAHGLEHAGHALLAEARQEYLIWGAAAKVDRLDWAYPTLSGYDTESPGTPQRDSRASRRSSTMAGTIDLLGILNASQALSSETSIDRLRARVVEVVSAMTGATGVQMLVWNEDERRWLVAAPRGRGMVPLADAGRRRLVPLSAIRYAERTREALVVVDATRDDRFARDPYFARMECCSLMVVPVVNRGVVQSLLLLENRLIRGAFSRERLDSVMLIAAQLAVSLDNATVYASLENKVAERTEELAFTNELLRLANERLEQLSVTDPLTDLANRRRLGEVLDAEWRRAQAAGSPISLAMIDVDDFKLYNDRYGHAAGDRCLQRVAAQVRRSVRETDLAARYGGEEFAVVMPGTDVKCAVEAAERLRTEILALAEPHAVVANGIITVSIGVATMIPPEHGTWEQLVESADVQLYRAKRSGRNRVRAALPEDA
jgi:diguanylate cyclase (GGDEF)-like protein